MKAGSDLMTYWLGWGSFFIGFDNVKKDPHEHDSF
jgi:hypothetical protein